MAKAYMASEDYGDGEEDSDYEETTDDEEYSDEESSEEEVCAASLCCQSVLPICCCRCRTRQGAGTQKRRGETEAVGGVGGAVWVGRQQWSLCGVKDKRRSGGE